MNELKAKIKKQFKNKIKKISLQPEVKSKYPPHQQCNSGHASRGKGKAGM